MDKRELFGVEIELEEAPYAPSELTYQIENAGIRWSAISDGTLRNNGVEFVSRAIQSQKDLACIDELMDAVGMGQDNQSFRCSSHIHLNCNNLSPAKRFYIYLGLASIDRQLFEVAGRGRDKSPFCVPVSSPLTLAYGLGNLLQIGVGAEADLKYLSVNPMAIHRHGSIELRHFHPFTDTESLVEVMDIVLPVYDAVIKVGSLKAFMNQKFISPVVRDLYESGALNQWRLE